jgi:hypothetical protein
MMQKLGTSAAVLAATLAAGPAAADVGTVSERMRDEVVATLIAAHGESHSDRIRRGVRQVAERWWEEDGGEDAFRSFCEKHFLADEESLGRTFERLSRVIEQVDGHLHEVRREITAPLQLDTGPVLAVDELMSGIDLATHVDEDLFRSKVAFLALLNFPVHTLEERLQNGPGWSRDTWARSRLLGRFALRVPAEVAQHTSRAFTAADQYIADYNVRMDRLLDESGRRPFPEGLRLITHWGLRDEIKSQYAEKDGLAKQRLILEVMRRITHQEIPRQVIDNPDLAWSPHSNEVRAWSAESATAGAPVTTEREPDVRYQRLLDVFRAVRAADPYSPVAPTYVERRFRLEREIPEADVEALLVSVLESKELRELAAGIRKRLGRPLEPFDIWYDGFKARSSYNEADLDRIVRERYPDVAAFQADLPRILGALGFSAERATWLADRIVVDPSRGAGHALGAQRREDKAHLRTRIGPGGMDYKGYNIAIHELGHNVEQVFSLNAIDHWTLAGVPNTAFTEALAFVFQDRDLELLGLEKVSADRELLAAKDTLWGTAEIGGVALVDMGVWRYLYEHPDATAGELREATLAIARDVWNRYFAPVFGVRDQTILAVYSHMIAYGLYLPDYPIGHIIAFQVADRVRGDDFGAQFERVARLGRLTPDLWMRNAVGSPISARPLLDRAGAK